MKTIIKSTIAILVLEVLRNRLSSYGDKSVEDDGYSEGSKLQIRIATRVTCNLSL